MKPSLSVSYSDNKKVTVAQRLIDEISLSPKVLDIVTGYLAPSAWEILGDSLDQIGRFRLILGKDFEMVRKASKHAVEERIKEMVRVALRDDLQATTLPTAQDARSVRRVLEFLDRPDDIVDFRVFEGDGEFQHAKAYILDGSTGVGSANFTANGLLHNRELVAWRQDRHVVAELNEWFEDLWKESKPYKAELREVIASSRFGDRAWTPYDVLIRTLAERYGVELPKTLEAARFSLKWFQEDAVFRLIRLLRGPAGGALLADAVGLGKTYMALGIIHHFLYESTEKRIGRHKPVLIVVPASMYRTWHDELVDKGMDWACNLITLQSLRGDFDVHDVNQADLVIIDEAHRLRGEGIWFQQAMRIVTTGTLNKRVLLLTATPVHTGVTDLTNLLRLMTKNRRDAWAPAIADFDKYLQRVERRESDPFPVLDRSVVRRSRTDILKALEERQAAGVIDPEPLRLPKRDPRHVSYTYGGKADLFTVFASTIRDLELAPYDMERFLIEDALFDPAPYKNNSSNLAGLFLAGLLKRFESSIRAVSISLTRLKEVLERSLILLEQNPPRLAEPKTVREFITTWTEGDVDGNSADNEWTELVNAASQLDPAVYDVARMGDSIRADIKRVERLRQAIPSPVSDEKIKRLRAVLTKGLLKGKRVLVFTQFRDTAIYLGEMLREASQDGADLVGSLEVIHGGTKAEDRALIAGSFDPNHAVLKLGEEPTRVLVATDVLAEGHNLQLAEAVINFDLHWNPQVIVQRAGRVDRLNSPHDKVYIYSFLPEEGLDAHLNLANTIDKRFGRIHFLGLGDESVTQFSQDVQTRTFEQIRRLYADDASVFDEIEQSLLVGSTDFMRQPLEKFLREAIQERVNEIPLGVQSVKTLPVDWKHGAGTFIAFRHGEPGRGETIWRFYPEGHGSPLPLADETAIFRAIVCSAGTPRGDVPPTTAVLIDFDLLRRAATDVADAINRRSATASVARGASERSRKIRERLIILAKRLSAETEKLDAVLDRLDEVRIEDFDHEHGYRAFIDALKLAEKSGSSLTESEFAQVLESALDLIGTPSDSADENKLITPDELVLVAWETLILPAVTVSSNGPRAEQLTLE